GCVPDHCPLGSEGGMCNGHPCCRTVVCSPRDPCAAGSTCAEVRLCVVPGGGRSLHSRSTVREVVGYVDEDKGCAAGSVQEIIHACPPASPAGAPPSRRGLTACGCDLAAPSAPWAFSPLVLALAALVARRRGHRSS